MDVSETMSNPISNRSASRIPGGKAQPAILIAAMDEKPRKSKKSKNDEAEYSKRKTAVHSPISEKVKKSTKKPRNKLDSFRLLLWKKFPYCMSHLALVHGFSIPPELLKTKKTENTGRFTKKNPVDKVEKLTPDDRKRIAELKKLVDKAKADLAVRLMKPNGKRLRPLERLAKSRYENYKAVP